MNALERVSEVSMILVQSRFQMFNKIFFFFSSEGNTFFLHFEEREKFNFVSDVAHLKTCLFTLSFISSGYVDC